MAKKLDVRRDRGVIVRDLVIFQIKLFLDGLKDVVMSPLAIGAAALDLLAPTSKRGARFYSVMRVGERIDRWLNLFGASRAGSNSLLGKIEAYMLGHDEQEPDREKSANRDADEVFAGTR